jgi:hypothetical protein
VPTKQRTQNCTKYINTFGKYVDDAPLFSFINAPKDVTATDEIIDRPSEVTRKIRIEFLGAEPPATLLRETIMPACDSTGK